MVPPDHAFDRTSGVRAFYLALAGGLAARRLPWSC